MMEIQRQQFLFEHRQRFADGEVPQSELFERDASDFHLVTQHRNRIAGHIPNGRQRMRCTNGTRVRIFDEQHRRIGTLRFIDELRQRRFFVRARRELRVRVSNREDIV